MTRKKFYCVIVLLAAALLLVINATSLHSALVAALTRHYLQPSVCEPACIEGKPCRALSLKMEIGRRVVRVSAHDPLFVRFALTNDSCYGFFPLPVTDFIDPARRDLASRGKYGGVVIRIFDMDGVELLPRKELPRTGVVLYQPDDGAYAELQRRFDAQNWLIDLRPGQRIESVPSVLNPYTTVLEEDPTPLSDGSGTRIKRVPAVMPAGSVSPPEGFQAITDQFTFNKPGTYRVTAIYRAEAVRQAVFPRFERASPLIRSLLVWGGISPVSSSTTIVVESNESSVDFVVSR